MVKSREAYTRHPAAREDARTVRAHALRYVLDRYHEKQRAAGVSSTDGENDAKVKEDRADEIIISK